MVQVGFLPSDIERSDTSFDCGGSMDGCLRLDEDRTVRLMEALGRRCPALAALRSDETPVYYLSDFEDSPNRLSTWIGIGESAETAIWFKLEGIELLR